MDHDCGPEEVIVAKSSLNLLGLSELFNSLIKLTHALCFLGTLLDHADHRGAFIADSAFVH